MSKATRTKLTQQIEMKYFHTFITNLSMAPEILEHDPADVVNYAMRLADQATQAAEKLCHKYDDVSECTCGECDEADSFGDNVTPFPPTH